MQKEMIKTQTLIQFSLLNELFRISLNIYSEYIELISRYSFLFENHSNFCALEQSQVYIIYKDREVGARYLDPKYSMWKSTDPALNEYMSGSDAGEGGVYNHINLNLYHYAGNNPIRYIDPDGRKLTLTVDKSKQKMNICLSLKIGSTVLYLNYNIKITTHVIADSDSKQSNKKANENLDPDKRNPNGSAWTQFPNGEWNITGVKEGPNQNVDGVVDEQLTTDAHQVLKVRNADGSIKVDKDNNEITVDDRGYNIHFTSNSNTAGCIGIKDKIESKFLILLYKLNEKFDPKTSTIKVIGTEE